MEQVRRLLWDNEQENGGRKASQFALRAVIELIGDFPELQAAGHELPFKNLLWALLALDDGVVEPILKQLPPGRGGARDKQRDMFFAYALAIADLVPVRDLAERLSDAGYRTRAGKAITAEVIRQWRRDLNRLDPTDFRRERYDAARQGLGDAPAGTAEARIETLIRRFPPHILSAG